jgi:extracellular elastinolytic metalloproteinase
MHMRKQGLAVLALAIAGSLFSAASALGAGDIQGSSGLSDLDVRTGSIAPTAAQRAGARALGAAVAWNDFGTPSTLVRPGGGLGATVEGATATATAAARTWLERNRALFRLSSATGLEQVNDSTLAGKTGHAVTFRQAPGGLEAAGGGLVTIGLTQASGAWRVVSASSTISGDETLAPGGAKLSDGQAWQRAAASVGRSTSLARVSRVSARKLGLGSGWKALRVAGLADIQRSREVAFPTLSRGYIPAFETLVLDTSGPEPAAYRVIVDAKSGAVLSRDSLVDNEGEPSARAAQATDPAVQSFSGTLPPQDGACDTTKGPLTVSADSGGRAIDVFANADTPAQDIVLKLFRGATQVAEADTLRTPERIRYEPQGGVPAGDYFAQVCEFGPDGAPPVEPRTYTGTIGLDTTAPPAAFLARWRVFPANPPLNPLAQDPWNNPSTDTRENWCWRQSPTAADCNRVVGNLASRSPWDFDPKTNAVTNTTTGNNARTAESWTDPILPSPNQFRPVSAGRDYSFPWTNAWFNKDCDPGTPYGANFQVGQSFDVSAAVTNLFVQHNRMHDFSYLLGFTEDNWNAQNSNFGLTEATRENDPVVGDTQAGAATPPPGVYANARDNANMITLPDGTSSITNMYLWQPIAGAFYAPCVDGDYDAGVIGHEYTHMIENRTIGKGSNRTGFQAGAMGEAAGDLFSIEQLNENGLVPTDDENPFATGTYATGNKLRGIRNYAANFPYTGAFPEPGVYPRVDPLNFSDVGYDLTGPEVHADGEIWVAINFEVRRALAAKYDAQFPESDRTLQASCAAGTTPVTQCPGNRRWIQLLMDAFLLMPTAPSMVDARNAILAADQARFGGADIPTLWAAFARRGLGRFASQTNGSGRTRGVESDFDPLPDFEAVGQPNARITFRAQSAAGGAAPKARIYVGHYEARVSPIADTDAATNAPATASANNLDQTAVFAPGTYEFIATAPGFGAVRFRETFAANRNRTITLRMAPNLASAAAGATASGDAAPVTSGTTEVQPSAQVLRNLIDDTEATDWQSAATQGADGAWNVDGNKVTVDLAGTTPQRVNRVQVSAMLGPVFSATAGDLTQNRFTAVRRFEIWSCNARVADCAQDDSYQRAFISGADAFPADAPRPVAPMLLLRSFAFSAVRATHLRIVVRSSQCTDGPAFQGEQDADPFNATDCNSAGPATTRFVRVAELQAYGAASGVQ